MSIQVTAHGNRLASLGQKIIVNVDRGIVTVKAPLYRRAIPIADIVSLNVTPDDGKNHGLLNWFVTGNASSPDGVHLNNGGNARVDILTKDGARYGAVVDTLEQATQIVNAIEAESPTLDEGPAIS